MQKPERLSQGPSLYVLGEKKETRNEGSQKPSGGSFSRLRGQCKRVLYSLPRDLRGFFKAG